MHDVFFMSFRMSYWQRFVWCFTALVSLHTAGWSSDSGPLTVRSGPYMVMGAGVMHVGIELTADEAAIAAVRLRYDGAEPLEPLGTDRREGAWMAHWVVPMGPQARSFTIDLGADKQRTGQIPALLGRDGSAAIAVIGEGAWPTNDELERLGTLLDMPIQAVLVLGQNEPRGLGSGGWEERLPIMVPGASGLPAPRWLLGAGGSLPRGIRWGALGLPCALNAAQAGQSLGAIGGLWSVLCVPTAPWDPSLVAAPAQTELATLAPLVSLGSGLQIPLMLGGGSLAGLLSEPLSMDQDGAVAVRPSGMRYVLVPGIGDGLATMVPAVAFAQEGRVLCGLRADDEALVLAWSAAPKHGGDVLMSWSAVGIQSTIPDGWGRGDAKALVAVLKSGLATDTGEPPTPEVVVAGEAMSVLARPLLHMGDLDEATWKRLRELAEASEAPAIWARRLVTRLVADGDVRVLHGLSLDNVPSWARRELALRLMSDPHEVISTWIGTVANTQDSMLVRAAMVRAERSTLPADLNVLVERLRRQAAGTTPVDADPVLQSRLNCVVFDSPWLSPTPLRPIARDLLPRLSGLGAAPVQRFLTRVGSERPTTP